jgi:hypothetical protein
MLLTRSKEPYVKPRFCKCLISREFVLSTDASALAISAVLQQNVNEDLAPIAYYSRLLTPAERHYSTYEKECLAVLFGCEKGRSYLEHKEF